MDLHSNLEPKPAAQGAGTSWNTPLLITGCARTGTSALARSLSTHDRICIFNEYSLYYPPALEDSAYQRICAMRDNPPPAKIYRDLEGLQARMKAELSSDASDIETTRWLFRLLQAPVQIFGDKMPYLYLANMDAIARRLPAVRFLLTLRDGRDVVASQIRRYHRSIAAGVEPEHWMRPNVEEAEFLWLRSARKWLAMRDELPAPCLVVRYEDATRSPENLARRICDFVGMEYRRDEFQGFLAEYRPVHTDAWREEIPDIEDHLSAEFREALCQLGYD